MTMGSKQNTKKKKADGMWISDERRITEECRKVYPALYRLQRIALIIASVALVITLVTPTIFSKSIAGYESWRNTYEIATIVLTLVLLVLYGVANYFWQEKMKLFRAESEKKKLKKKK